ncbi:hypothetical protein [Micavibrio aeruginosavorus]|uniref:hypothetical protein n=1 Tax=Micavibrio aeruginosavorus TaxID=349221 RepID=UPI003F4A96D6
MDYIPPVNGNELDPNRPYINANPGAGIQGSIIPAEAIEHTQREIINAITAAGLEPDPENLNQLAEAIQALAGSEKRIGEPFVLWDHLAGMTLPDNSGSEKYIKLTAGQTGVGQYNEGLLGSESVSGTAPLVQATSTILVGPLAGQTVRLINTERSFLRPDTTSGVLTMDCFQGHLHPMKTLNTSPGGSVNSPYYPTTGGSESTTGMNPIPVSDGTNGTPRVGNETRPKAVSATAYLRIV